MRAELESMGYYVDLGYAENDVSLQIAQIDEMIEDGCNVIIVAAVEGYSLGGVLDKAAERNVRIIAYDRLLMGNEHVDYYTTFDNYNVGVLQGTYVRDHLGLDEGTGPYYIEFTAGDPGDNNAAFFFYGAMDILRPYIDSGKVIVKSGQTDFSTVATPAWRSENAQQRAESLLSAFYADGSSMDAWVCSNDSTAMGVMSALEDWYAGRWPIITGQDCDRPNVKKILEGKQSMSVIKQTSILASQAVKMAVQILEKGTAEVNDTATYDNGTKIVPTFLCNATVCDINNYRELLINTGFYTEEDLTRD